MGPGLEDRGVGREALLDNSAAKATSSFKKIEIRGWDVPQVSRPARRAWVSAAGPTATAYSRESA